MASLPPQRPQPRQAPASPSQSTSPSAIQQPRADSATPSARSIDSQTLFVNETPASASASTQNKQDKPDQQVVPHPQEDEDRKCWICFQDEVDDGPDASPWRSPCPCALTAHEQCLLDWIADTEAPDPRRATAAPKVITCPQCKSEIHLSRPRSLIVEAASRIEKAVGQMIVPGVLAGLSCGIFLLSSHHGEYTIRAIFGPEDAQRILHPAPTFSRLEHLLQLYAPPQTRPWFEGWRGFRLTLGLPLIPITLIASRTTQADAVLPILPIVFFATHPEHQQEITNGVWPPSAALTLVVLPYIRGIYDDFVERYFGELERGWMKEIRPRLGNTSSSASEAHGADVPPMQDEDHIVDIELDFEADTSSDEGGDDEQAEPRAQIPRPADETAEPPPAIARDRDRGDAPAFDAPPRDDTDRPIDRQNDRQEHNDVQRATEHMQEALALQERLAAERGNGAAAARRPQQRRAGDWIVSVSRLAEIVMGALAFPSVCAVAGETLRLTLPAAWVAAPPQRLSGAAGRAIPAGLLQTRWGRSIVGGCLFVVLKDAVRIYCRWRMALAFRNRRVQDYDKKTGRTVDPADRKAAVPL